MSDAGPRIARVELQRVEDVPLPRPLALAWDPGTVRTVDSFTIARVHSDAGMVGVGTVGRAKPARTAARELVGRALYDHEANARILHDAGGAYGLDIALWDLIGRHRDEPLWRLWGGGADRVRAYASTVEIGSVAQRARDAVGFADEGFRGLKLRLHHETIADDLALAAAVRESVGDRLVLMADANQARAAAKGTSVRWTPERALATARGLAALGFAWLEEPLAGDDLTGLSRLRAQAAEAGIAIAGGERDVGYEQLAAVTASGAYDIVQPDGVTGEAVSRFVELAALARSHGARVVPHHGGGGVGAWGHLHLAAGLGDAGWFEVIRDRPGETPWPAQLVPVPRIAIDAAGDVVAPVGPGLGITLDEELLAAHTVATTVIDGDRP